MSTSKEYLNYDLDLLSQLDEITSCNDGRIHYLLSWQNCWRNIR